MKPAGSRNGPAQVPPTWSQEAQDQETTHLQNPDLSSPHIPNRRSGHSSDWELTVEDISGLDKGYDADIEVINPYHYEEADSIPNTPANTHPAAKRDVNIDNLWKHEIVDSMKSLDCNSETDMPEKRGVKRKPKDTVENMKHEAEPRDIPLEVVEIGNDDQGFSPKRIRRKSQRQMVDGSARNTLDVPAPSTTMSDESSSAYPLSTEESRSSTESLAGVDPDDKMDIDRSPP